MKITPKYFRHERAYFIQEIRKCSLTFSKHAHNHLHSAERNATLESDIRKLMQTKPVYAHIQANGTFRARFRKKSGFIDVIVAFANNEATIVTFIDKDR